MSEKRTTRGLDPEIQAMAKIDNVMSDLSAPVVELVYAWFERKYGPANDNLDDEPNPLLRR